MYNVKKIFLLGCMLLVLAPATSFAQISFNGNSFSNESELRAHLIILIKKLITQLQREQLENGVVDTVSITQNQGEVVKAEKIPSLTYDKNFLSVDKKVGVAPLRVTFTPSTGGMSERWVEFGDGSKQNITCNRFKPDTDACLELSSPMHVYTKAGTYVATYKEYRSGANAGTIDTLGYVVISVQ